LLLAVKEKPFRKIYIFWKIIVNLLAAFQGFRMFLLAKNHWKAAGLVLKLFWKPISTTQKGFGNPLINHI
jgi:hypothetical protein